MEDDTQFLSDNGILPNLSEALKAADRADLAVAYWGATAVRTLCIDKVAGPVRVLCDAYSGACNPDELTDLLEMKKVELRTRNGLHAKVFITSTSLIVGSANASANGLGQEGVEASNLEAAALIKDRNCLQNARDWFNLIWNDARKVTPDVIREIRPIWRERRQGRPTWTAKSSSLLGVLLDDPEWFKDREIRLVAYEGSEISKAARAKFDAIASSLYHPTVLHQYDANNEIPLYEDDGNWHVSAGDYILDYNIYRKKGQAIFQGLWRIRSHDAFHKAGPGSRIILCDKARDFKGLRLAKSDGTRLGKLVFQYVSSKKFKADVNGNMLEFTLDKAAEAVSLKSLK